MTTTRALPADVAADTAPVEDRHRTGLRRVLVIALAVILLAELGVRLVEDRLPPTPDWFTPEYGLKQEQMAGLAARTDGASVVFIGSSVIDVSIDPTKIDAPVTADRPAYNAGLIGANLEMVDVWSGHVVEPALHPDVVVLAVSSRDVNRNGAGLESQTPNFYKLPAVRRLLGTESILERVERRVSDVSRLVKHRNELRRPLEAIFGYDSPDRNLVDNAPLGQELHLLDVPARFDPAVDSFFRAEPLLNFVPSETQFGAMRRTIKRLQGAGVRVIVLDVPVTAQYIALHPRGAQDYLQYEVGLNILAAQTGAELVDTGTWTQPAFSDPLHLNRLGADELTALVDQYLQDGRVVLPPGSVPPDRYEGGVAEPVTVP
jgi:hypothetical protein